MNRLFLFVFMTMLVSNSYAQNFISSKTIGNETKTYSKILVVAKAKNDTRRIEAEDDIVKRLKKKGIDAVPSYMRLTKEMIKKNGKNEEALELFVETLRKNGFDGILATSLVAAKESVEYTPGQYSTTTVPARYGRFGRYYGATSVGVYEPGYIEKHKNFVFESLLYDLRGSSKEDSLHWIGKIKVTDPVSFEKTSEKFAKKVVKQMAKEAID